MWKFGYAILATLGKDLQLLHQDKCMNCEMGGICL